MTTDNPIAKHLKEYHCGELRVVPSRELEAAFQIRGPDLRRTINCLRGDGIPISRVYAGELLCGSTLYGEKDGNAIRQSSMP